MDEPTSSLDSEETNHLFQVIRDLKAQNVAIIYISHRMEEIFEICDSVAVFRDGTYVGARSMENVTRPELISMMVGREVSNVFPKVTVPIGETVFKVEGLCGDGFSDISFEVHAGEILRPGRFRPQRDHESDLRPGQAGIREDLPGRKGDPDQEPARGNQPGHRDGQ